MAKDFGWGTLYVDSFVVNTFRNTVLGTLGKMNAESFYDGKPRITAIEEAEKVLRERFAPRGFKVEKLLLRNFKYADNYERSLKDKKVAVQLTEKNRKESLVNEEQAKLQQIESKGNAAITIAELVRATLRHRPDRILVGEVRGPEAFDLLQALNTGHLGSMTTIHANNAEQALTRLAHCVLTANVGLPHRSTREAIALAIHMVVHLARLDARRVVTEVVRVQNYDPHEDRFVVQAWSPPQACREGATA